MAEIKDLIAYAREQKVLALEAHGVKFQFSPIALEPSPRVDLSGGTPKAPATDEAPFGHFDPDREE